MAYIYLASPYSHPNKLIVQERYEQVSKVTAQLLREGKFVYSPIVHCHELAMNFKLPTNFDFWKKYGACMLVNSRALWILRLPGYKDSVGVKGEIEIAEEFNIPVSYITP